MIVGNPELNRETIWLPDSWRNFKISQQPVYKNKKDLESVLKKISKFPGIVNFNEIIELKSKLSKCHDKNNFIIQIGDCSETFQEATEEVIHRKLTFFNIISHILTYHLKKEVIVIGRIAGQYAKPRSNDFEIINNQSIESFRGEIVNDFNPCVHKRVPDPDRMLMAYYASTITINKIKEWNFYEDKSLKKFKNINKNNIYNVNSEKFLKKLSHYYETFPEGNFNIDKNKIYSSHEGLLLNYEECFIRQIDNVYYNLSSHFLWIGERTRKIDEAHVEFFRGISNPIGIKTSQNTNFRELIEVIKIVNPKNEKGKVCIITRFGTNSCETYVNNLSEIIKESGVNVIFMCDPSHGNTKVHSESGKKVRYFDELKEEILITNKALQENGLFLSGIHLEASSFDVTECIGGLDNEVSKITEDQYTTYCDPRLNMLQTMELCDIIGNLISGFNIE